MEAGNRESVLNAMMWVDIIDYLFPVSLHSLTWLRESLSTLILQLKVIGCWGSWVAQVVE